MFIIKAIRASNGPQNLKPNGVRKRLGGTACLPLLLLLSGSPITAAAVPAIVPDLIRSALAHHPSLRSQEGRRDAAQAGVRGARWQFFPTPSIAVQSPSWPSDDAGTGDEFSANIGLQQPLWTGGRLTGNLTRAEAQAAAAAAEMDETKLALAQRVVQVWTDALVAQRKLEAYEESRKMHERLLGLVKRRHGEGASALADVALADARLDSLRAELQATAAQLVTAIERLRLLVGRDPSPYLAQNALQAPVPAREHALGALLAAARLASPALEKAGATVAVAEADIKLARAALAPEVFVRAEHQFGSQNRLQSASDSRVFVGVNKSFGAGLSSFSGIDAATAHHRAALDDVETQQLALDEQIRADYALASSAEMRLAGLESARRSVRDVLDSYERQFLAGRKQWLDLMNAAREQAQNDVQLADALGARQIANWRLALLSRGVEALVTGDPTSHSAGES